MRPVVAIAGAALLVVLGLLAYFVPGGYTATGPVSAGAPEVITVPSAGSFLPNLPVTLTVNNLPPGAQVTVYPCPAGATQASACQSAGPQFYLLYNVSLAAPTTNSITLHFNINAGHPFVVSTSAAYGAQASYTATVPLWAEQTWIVLVLLFVGIVLVAVGLSSGEPETPAYGYVESSGYAGTVAPKRFCENCGNPYPDSTTSYCPTCSAPRW